MYNLITLRWKKKKEREENMNCWTLVCCEGKMRKGKSDKSNRISLSKKFNLFYTKNLHFLFYAIIFTKYSHQFIYYTHFFY